MNSDSIPKMSVEEIKTGFSYNPKNQKYKCLFCEEEFEEGDIYPFDGHLLTAHKAVVFHVKKAHQDVFTQLLQMDKKYSGLTEKQKEIMAALRNGKTANTIAAENGTSPATVRYQHYILRERAKQAKLFLALFELMEEYMESDSSGCDQNHKTVHNGAKMVDERYFTTEEAEEKILKDFLSCRNPIKLTNFPAMEKKKIVILRAIVQELDRDRVYTEKELNEFLKQIYDDYATLRRYMIEYGFMERTSDCSKYWIRK